MAACEAAVERGESTTARLAELHHWLGYYRKLAAGAVGYVGQTIAALTGRTISVTQALVSYAGRDSAATNPGGDANAPQDSTLRVGIGTGI